MKLPRLRLSRHAPTRGFTSASTAASAMLATHSKPKVRRQLLDGNQLQKLALTLGQDATPPADGTPIPPGHHLVYFTDGGTEAQLGPDGTDRTYNAPAPYTRRMWAGGHVVWDRKEPQLRVGDVVEEHTRLVSATPKRSRSGAEMVLVEVLKEFRGPRGTTSVADTRSWIFRPEIVSPADATAFQGLTTPGPTTISDSILDGEPYPTRQMSWSAVGLFRFSALLFNGHRIHYDGPWSRDVEGHPGIVVHGPLNLINMLDYWRHLHGRHDNRPGEVRYRALAPLYAGDVYHIKTVGVTDCGDGTKTYDVVAVKDGLVCMTAQVTAG